MEGFKHKINKEFKREKAKIEQEMLGANHDHHDAVAGKEVISQTTEGQDLKSEEATTEKETNEMLDSEQKRLLKSKRKRILKALTLEPEQKKEEADVEYFQKLYSLMSLNKDFPRFSNFLKSSIRFMNRANAYSIQKKGRVLIIENTEFDSPDLKTRVGSDKDREKLETFFQDLGFKVIIKRNLKADEMIQVLHVEVDKNEGRNEDCFILIFLSHGQKSEIFGSDSKTITYSAIYKEFNESTIWNDDSQPKPKLIYIQACQNAFEEKTNPDYSPGGHFYVMYATIPGDYAYRNEQNGSRFIQSLISVYKKNFLDEDIQTMGKKIQNVVYETPNVAQNTQQIAVVNSSLVKSMYLPEVQEKKKTLN